MSHTLKPTQSGTNRKNGRSSPLPWLLIVAGTVGIILSVTVKWTPISEPGPRLADASRDIPRVSSEPQKRITKAQTPDSTRQIDTKVQKKRPEKTNTTDSSKTPQVRHFREVITSDGSITREEMDHLSNPSELPQIEPIDSP